MKTSRQPPGASTVCRTRSIDVGFRRAVLAGLILPLAAAMAPAQTAPAPLRVALVDFTSDDGFLRSAAAAADISGSVQAELAGEPDVVWVERSQLQLAAREQELGAGGFTSGGSALRLGKLVRADLAVVGHFLRNEKNDEGHTFRLEVVDLRRADTLATRSFLLPGDRRSPIRVSPELLRTAAASTREALAEARGRFAQGTRQQTVGLLYFRNDDASPRLDRYGDGFNAAFAADAAGPRAGNLRILQFPHAFDALGEAELSVLGLSEGDPDAWRHVANFYVWGSYHEMPSKDLPFERVTVEATLFLWDGRGLPRPITETATVADLPALTQRLSEQVCGLAAAAPETRPAVPANANDDVAAWLLARAAELGASLTAYGPPESRERTAFAATPQGQAMVRQQSRLLETACFFAPLSRRAQLARLTVRWPGFPQTLNRLPFLRQWQRADELDAFVQSFPLERDNWTMQQASVNADARLLEELSTGERWLDDPRATRLLPIDATGAEIAAWHAQLEARFAGVATRYVREVSAPDKELSAGAYTCGDWIDAAAKFFVDQKTAAALIETIWPIYDRDYQRERAILIPGSSVVLSQRIEAVRKLFAALGQPERGETLLAARNLPTPTPRVPTRTASAGANLVGAFPRPALAPVPVVHPTPEMPTLRPGWRTIPLPAARTNDLPASRPVARADGHPVRWTNLPEPTHRATVCALEADENDLLWMSVERRTTSFNRTAAADFSVWQVSPATDEVEDLTARLGLDGQTPVTSLLAADGALWLTPRLGGVWQVDADTATLRHKHTLEDGLLDLSLDAAAAGPDGRLYFSGSHEGQGLMNVCLPGAHAWSRVDLPVGRTAMPTQASVCGHWMLAGPGPWVLHDLDKGGSQDLTARFDDAGLPRTFGPAPAALPPPFARSAADAPISPRRRTCLADQAGFWLTAGARLAFFDPASGRIQSWPALPTSISALASVGEDLWVVCPAQAPSADTAGCSDVAVLHKPTGAWRGSFRVDGYVTCTAVSQRAVYLGLQDAEEPLVEVEKSSLPPRP